MTTLQSAQEQISSLHLRLMNAQVSFDLWEEIYNARLSTEIVETMNLYPTFFTGVEAALFNSFIVLIYSVFEKRFDTVSLHTLLRTLDKSLSQDKKFALSEQLSLVHPIWTEISILRNQVVGHQALDKSQAKANTFSKAQLRPEEIQELIARSQLFVTEISSSVFNNMLIFNIKSKPDLHNLLTDVTRKNKLGVNELVCSQPNIDGPNLSR